MSSANNYYSTLDVDYAFPNDSVIDTTDDEAVKNAQVFAQFNSVVANMFFTPDHDVSPEDLQFRISKDAKFFLGSNDTNADNSNYTLRMRDVGGANELELKSYHNRMGFSADKLHVGGVTVSDFGANSTRVSTPKMLQIHSGERFEFEADAEFKEESKFDKNVYVGDSLIFQQASYGGDSNEQVRIAFQYNQNRDTLDLVKQLGTGVDTKKKLMARLGGGPVAGGSLHKGAELSSVPYYNTYSQTYNADAPVYEDIFDSWIDANSSSIGVDSFANDAGYLTTLQETPVNSKWRFREVDGDGTLRIEKFNGTEWVLKFQFEP